jgi:hypothetical protein
MAYVNEKSSLQLAEITENLSNERIGIQLIDIAYSSSNSALNQSMKCTLGANHDFDLDAYKSDVTRILNKLEYDKIDDYRSAKFVNCSDGVILQENRDFDISHNNGMCYDLAFKAATLIKLMYPDRDIAIGHDLKRPCGWNHFFVIDKTDAGDITTDMKNPQENVLIIDPSENKVGRLVETGNWDKTGVWYKIDEVRGLHDSRNTQFLSYLHITNDEESNSRGFRLPLFFRATLEKVKMLSRLVLA